MYVFLSEQVIKLLLWCKKHSNAPEGYASGLSCKGCSAGMLSEIPTEADILLS